MCLCASVILQCGGQFLGLLADVGLGGLGGGVSVLCPGFGGRGGGTCAGDAASFAGRGGGVGSDLRVCGGCGRGGGGAVGSFLSSSSSSSSRNGLVLGFFGGRGGSGFDSASTANGFTALSTCGTVLSSS